MTSARYAALFAALAVASCAGGAGSGASSIPAPLSGGRHHGSSRLIQHVVIIIQENRSFDNLFATFPGADGARRGKMSNGKSVRLKKEPLHEICDFGHSYKGFIRDYDGGKMDGFNLEGGTGACPGPAGRKPYQYVDPTQIAPYWDMAEQYVLGDRMFQTQGSGSYTAHQDLIRGATTIDPGMTQSLVDYPTHAPWGCDAPTGTVTSLLEWTGSILQRHPGPFPCTKDFPGSGSSYATLRDLLDAKSVSWKYYTPPLKKGGSGSGSLWNAFDTVWPVRNGSEWGTKVVWPETEIFGDITGGTLPAVSWVIPDAGNSDHPEQGSAKDTGPSWVASVVNAVGQSQYWDSTAVVIVWDDWGGFYDHVKPPLSDHWGGLGFRVPMIVVSAYAREAKSGTPGLISHTQYEFGSILRFVEDNWKLGHLGTTDQRPGLHSIGDVFDFTQEPRPFQVIPSTFSREYFLRQPPSLLPVDTE